jgi:hypothetical protein
MKSGSHHTPMRPLTVAGHMVSPFRTLLPLVVGTLLAGMLIYRYAEGLAWSDAFLNASMLLGGMGPVDRLTTTIGKWLAGCYALFAGLVFILLVGTMLAPVFHAVLHRFHLESGSSERD